MLILLPISHPLSKKAGKQPPWPQIRLSDLRNESFILLNQGRRLRRIADQCFMNAGFQPKILLESQIPETIYNLVRAGMGITFGTDRFRKFGIYPEEVTYFALDEPLPPRAYSVIYQKERPLPRAALDFIALAKEVFASREKSFN